MNNSRIHSLVTFAIVALLVGLGVAAGMVIAPLKAQSTFSSIGFVDVQKAIESHPKRQAVYEQIKAFTDAKKKEFDSMKGTGQLTEQQTKDLAQKYYEIQEQISAEEKRLTDPLIQDVLDATNKVGQDSGIEVILESGSVMYGGLDLTPQVVAELGGTLVKDITPPPPPSATPSKPPTGGSKPK